MIVNCNQMDTDRFIEALGRAVLNAWGDLPRAVQETIFEGAVLAGHQNERDESLREQLAEFLHDEHPRTAENSAAGENAARRAVQRDEHNRKPIEKRDMQADDPQFPPGDESQWG